MELALDVFFLIVGGLSFRNLYNRHIDWKYKDERGYLINVWIFFINYPIMFYLMDRMLFFVVIDDMNEGCFWVSMMLFSSIIHVISFFNAKIIAMEHGAESNWPPSILFSFETKKDIRRYQIVATFSSLVGALGMLYVYLNY